MKPRRRAALAAAALTVAAGLGGTALAAQREDPQVAVGRAPKVAFNHSFVSPLVEVFGDVRVGRKVFIAGNTVVRADPGHRVCIGSETNLQDNILFLALSAGRVPRAPCGRRSSSTQERVSIAHQAEIVNSRIGSFTFVGFHARLSNVVLEDGAFVLHGAVLRDVRIRRDRIVPVGAVITTQAQADALARKADAQSEFQREVLEVNEEFAERYPALYRSRGYRGVVGASRAPRTTFNNGRARPAIGARSRLEPFARLVGDVRLGADSEVGRRTSIRADEGSPIIIGDNAGIEDRVTFHALKGTSIRIGRDLDTDDNVVFHGPLVVGDRLTIADDAVLFRATVGSGVTIGDGALVVGPADGLTIPDGKVIPAGAIITSQAALDALP